ncbi:MAG: UDP-N-acetylmuramoyl-L-alanine--D-glutamate ligase [Lactobacillales bacterium]|jgi:UDP-N-acetylmuramoylalanine--D-glutamate ligase|nr:UDP-N-acetylmuramoyl-L-alanine--D-glutamate ligase [Lactobacillales bacterium]
MKNITTYKNKKILVLGLAKTGVSVAKALHKLGAIITVNDGKPLAENPEAQELIELGITVITGSHPVELLDDGIELIFKNPGIPYTVEMLQRAKQLKIPVITDVELAYQISDAPIIGITGTNGKTTTTTLIGELLNAERKHGGAAFLAGNIGIPANDIAVEVTHKDDIVMELSSFQLKGTQTFRPHIAVITNLYEAHLDWHETREDYVASKWKIQVNMTSEDILILNANQEELRELGKTSKASVVYFSTEHHLDHGASYHEGGIYYHTEHIIDVEDVALAGMHNVENILAAVIVAKIKGVTNEAIAQVLAAFGGVAHRTQFVGEINGRKIYNDSKATNILATQKALDGFPKERTILIAGGLDRGNGFDELIPSLTGVKAAVFVGETKHKLEAAAKAAGIAQVRLSKNVETAAKEAYNLSSEGDFILLSPANASWDQYPNFETRGEMFMKAVNNLK